MDNKTTIPQQDSLKQNTVEIQNKKTENSTSKSVAPYDEMKTTETSGDHLDQQPNIEESITCNTFFD